MSIPLSATTAPRFEIQTENPLCKPNIFSSEDSCGIGQDTFANLHKEHFEKNWGPYRVVLIVDDQNNSALFDFNGLLRRHQPSEEPLPTKGELFVNPFSRRPWMRAEVIAIGRQAQVQTVSIHNGTKELSGFYDRYVFQDLEPLRLLGSCGAWMSSFALLGGLGLSHGITLFKSLAFGWLGDFSGEFAQVRYDEPFGKKDLARIALSTGVSAITAACVGGPILATAATNVAILGLKEFVISKARARFNR